MVMTPDIDDLPYTERRGVKYFELVAEPVIQEILPGIFIQGWGYNGSIPGPTIKAYPGDCINIRVYNSLNEPTSVHWHGLDIPKDMDGVKIQHGEYIDHRFRLVNPPGTHMYHTHFNVAKQEMMGLAGGLIILDPCESEQCSFEYLLILQEFAVKGLRMGELKPGRFEVEPLSDDLNFFTINGRSFPNTSMLPVRAGERIRIRIANPGMKAHPMHLHGHQFLVVSADGNDLNACARMLKNTVLVASGETYDIEFVADNPGNWPFHCHIPHHTANNMTPETGGMFTTLCYIRE
ncbi:MAG TPA: multicopper oxidase domain-containing protein [Selenomonadales bacterium]|nr:multicopper oxidase domain-containing protein [Selenomonadales bacterium]